LQTSLDRSFQEQFAANRAAALVPGRFSYSINSVHPPQVLYTYCHYELLKGLSHELDLAFDDMYD
jgi:hypothetical protein